MHQLPLSPRCSPYLLESAQDLQILGVNRKRLGKGFFGAPRVAEFVATPGRDTYPELAACRGSEVFDGFQSLREGVRRSSPRAVGDREALEFGQGVIVGRILGHRFLDGSLRARAIADHFLHDARELESGPRSVARRLGSGHSALVELREVLAAAERAVDELERLEGFVEERVVVEQRFETPPAGCVIGHALKSLPKSREPSRLLAKLPQLDCRQSVKELRLHVRVGLDRDATLEDVGKAPTVTQSLQQAVERAEYHGVVAEPFCRRDVRLRRPRRVVQLLLGDPPQAHAQVGRDVCVEDCGHSLLQGVCVPQPPFGSDPAGQALDLGVHRGILRLFRQRPHQRGLRPVHVCKRRLRHLREGPQSHRAVCRLRLSAQAKLEHGREFGVLARRAQDWLERVGRIRSQLVMRLAETADRRRRLFVEAAREHLAIGLERRLRILQLDGVQGRDALGEALLVAPGPPPAPPEPSGCRAARATCAPAYRERRGDSTLPRRPAVPKAPAPDTRWPRAGPPRSFS